MAHKKIDRLDDFVGVPIHRKFKQRIKRIAKAQGKKHVPMARELMEIGADQVERLPGSEATK